MDRLALVIGSLIVLGTVMQLRIDRRGKATRPTPQTPGWLKYGVFLAVILGLLVAAWLGRVALAIVFLVITLRGVHELHGAFPGLSGIVAGAIGGAVIVLGLGHLLVADEEGGFDSVAFGVVIVASTDAFSQLWGQLLGRRRLWRRVSPAKTVEGLLGGILTTVAAAVPLGPLLPESTIAERAAAALVTAMATVLGDLGFSIVKRAAGVKDFAAFLPGHGGIMDRFDGFVLAAPAYYWVARWLCS